ncbi:DUF6341 family protein [Cellulophaga baltica]|uniref:Uracil phosphoribosyltransferase n=1 Tax=Cellulophaga baltica TaxID=76594 RepID=A0A1G7FP70_9FLAO|nr:uracil phosphoribosyltransferase [Cellulophaga baltica]SDE77702.1 hypothetical protein SAMN04487992_103401 [Cellulophaga baltica]
MESFFRAIEDLFVNVLFIPLDALRFMHSWWGASTLNWIFMVIGTVAFVYWMLQLKKYNDSGEERKDVTGHSYL